VTTPNKRWSKKWTPDENIFLIYGLKQFGGPHWSEIFDTFEIRFNNRSKTALARKYLQLCTNGDATYYEHLVFPNMNLINQYFTANDCIGTVYDNLARIENEKKIEIDSQVIANG
jgi:hypothetical protein